MIDMYGMGQHFVPTSQSNRWRGKYKCLYCNSTGWPDNLKAIGKFKHWSHKHGENCQHKPASV